MTPCDAQTSGWIGDNQCASAIQAAYPGSKARTTRIAAIIVAMIIVVTVVMRIVLRIVRKVLTIVMIETKIFVMAVIIGHEK